jgi:fibronectin-binding autotransporter adhesin
MAPSAYAACIAVTSNGAFNASGTASCLTVTNQNIAGTVTNRGTIQPGGITLTNSTLTGALFDNAASILATGGNAAISIDANSKITAATSPVRIFAPTLTGGIINAGTITATSGTSGYGIYVYRGTSFSGGISNSGTISALTQGIAVTGTATAFTSFSGGVSNSGTISTSGIGIYLNNIGNVSGGVTNSGTITASGAGGHGIDVKGVSLFSGNIANTNFIKGYTGILVHNTSTFSGGISNSGTITSGAAGIQVTSVKYFGTAGAGGITNSGTITGAGSGILVDGLTSFSGGITNSGTIVATRTGIFVGASTFSGGITNSGTITGVVGMGFCNCVTGLTLSNTGTITGTGGTAIDDSQASGPINIQLANGRINGKINFSNFGDTLSGYGTVSTSGTITTGNATIFPTLGGTNILSILGNFQQNALGTTVIEVSPTAASLLQVSGNATLAGKLKLVFDPGTYNTKNYGAIVSSANLGGTTYATVSNNAQSGVTPTVTYTTTDVDLAITAPVTDTGPAVSTPPVVVSAGTNNAIFGSTGTIANTGFTDSGIVFDHLDEEQFGGSADQTETALAGTQPIQLAFNGQLAQLNTLGGALPDVMKKYGGWIRGIGSFTNVHGQNTAPGYSSSGGGVLTGFDQNVFGNLNFGVAAGYSGTNISQKDGTTGSVQTPRALLYGSWLPRSDIVVDAVASIAYDRISTSRPVSALGTNAVERHNGWEESLALQAGYVVPWDGFTVIPRAGLQYAHLSETGFSETGASGFNLTAPDHTTDSLQPTLSVSALRTFTTASGVAIVPEMKIAYSRELLSTNRNLVLTTASGSVAPALGVSPAHDTITVGPQVTAHMSTQLDLYADYKLTYGWGKSIANTIFGGARWNF